MLSLFPHFLDAATITNSELFRDVIIIGIIIIIFCILQCIHFSLLQVIGKCINHKGEGYEGHYISYSRNLDQEV